VPPSEGYATAGPTSLTGADLIAAERLRQITVEGWTPEHDAEHADDHLARAAAAYATPARLREPLGWRIPVLWPWAARFWKPTPDDRVRELVKAGALIAAEIDRLNQVDPRIGRLPLRQGGDIRTYPKPDPGASS
jgi:hypothetical protein